MFGGPTLHLFVIEIGDFWRIQIMIVGPVRVSLVCGLSHLAPLGIIQTLSLPSQWTARILLERHPPVKGNHPLPSVTYEGWRFQWFQPKQHCFHFSTRRFDGCPYQGKHTQPYFWFHVRKSSPIIWQCLWEFSEWDLKISGYLGCESCTLGLG